MPRPRRTHLMIRKYQRIRQNNILPPPRREDDNLGNIVGRQWLHALVHLLRLLLVTAESHDTEFCLHLTRVDLDDPNSCRDQLAAHGIGEGPHGGFGGTVDAAALIGFAAGDGADVYDVALAAVGSGFEDGQDGLCHGNEAGHVCGEHGVDVGGGDGGGLGDAFDEATVVALHVSGPAPREKVRMSTHALLTSTSMSLNSAGRLPTKACTSSTLLTSSLTGSTFTPVARDSISLATSFSVSSRRAVKMSLISGCVRANSTAVDLPIPDDAPVITIVLPLRRCAMLDDILVACSRAMLDAGVLRGVLRGRRVALAKAEDV
jgi:hypothetical protein